MVNFLIPAAIAFVILLLAGFTLNLGFLSLASIVLVIFVLAVLQRTGQITIARVNRQVLNVVIVGALLGGLIVGSFNFIPGVEDSVSAVMATFTGATIAAPGDGDGIVPIGLTDCQAAVADDIRGTSTTLTVNIFDRASDTPSSTKCVSDLLYFKNGQFIDTANVQGGSASISNVAVGDVITLFDDGTNSSCYVDTASFCITSQQLVVSMDGWNATFDEGIDITGFDDTGVTGLSAGTNTSEEDFDITLPATGEDEFHLQVKSGVADSTYNVGGFAILTLNDVQECEPTPGQGFTSIGVPLFLDSTIYLADVGVFEGISTSNETADGWERVWELANPDFLNEFDKIKYQFRIKAGQTDPTTEIGGDNSDICALVVLDRAVALDENSQAVSGLFQQDTNEANIGVIENTSHPLGNLDGVIIELI